MKLKISVLLMSILICAEAGILYPKYNLRRRLLSLDGLWNFALSGTGTFNNNESLTDNADDKYLHLMPVPSSYNDVLTSTIGRYYVGDVTYERNFLVPKTWQFESDRIWLRFASVSYSAEVYINGEFALSHKIGHLPFQKEVTSILNSTGNTITVKVNNNLTDSTIPQGAVQTLPDGRIKQTYSFDFFNYAGIDRPVVLYSTPSIYIDDITIRTTIDGTTGQVSYNIRMNGYIEINVVNVTYRVTILDNDRNEVVSRSDSFANIDDGNFNTVDIPNANFWWPYLMSTQPGYLYTLKVETTAHTETNTIIDEYEQKFGIRQLGWNESTVTINGKPIYIRGLGRHEDSDIRGRGFDLPLIVREHNLLRWLGVNCYRTSHYPYAEETMDLADSLGIMIIDESPAAELSSYNDELLLNHRLSLKEMYLRDKNRPSVIMWSVANEPTTTLLEAVDYFREVVTLIKSLDDTRPVILVNWQTIDQVKNVFNFLDIIGYNRYQGWYQNTANASAIPDALVEELTQWHETYNKPILITEYGADTLAGEYNLPSYIWSENYQNEVLSKHFEAFDTLRQKGWFLGEMIWTFADFATSQSFFRVGGNKKGIFTRERQPKAAASLLRERYWALAETKQ